jgi:hypothetical protein
MPLSDHACPSFSLFVKEVKGDSTMSVSTGVRVDERDKNKVPLKSAPPPWHTVVLVVGLLALLLPQLAMKCWSTIDEIATPPTYTRILFPGRLSVTQVGIIRLVLGCIMLGDAAYTVLWGKWEQDTDYVTRSKLIVVRKIPFRGKRHNGQLTSGQMNSVLPCSTPCSISILY